jgi:hypothetical protein
LVISKRSNAARIAGKLASLATGGKFQKKQTVGWPAAIAA